MNGVYMTSRGEILNLANIQFIEPRTFLRHRITGDLLDYGCTDDPDYVRVDGAVVYFASGRDLYLGDGDFANLRHALMDYEAVR